MQLQENCRGSGERVDFLHKISRVSFRERVRDFRERKSLSIYLTVWCGCLKLRLQWPWRRLQGREFNAFPTETENSSDELKRTRTIVDDLICLNKFLKFYVLRKKLQLKKKRKRSTDSGQTHLSKTFNLCLVWKLLCQN